MTDLSLARRAAGDLRSVILLAGQVGRNPFADGIGRSILDLPVTAGRTVLDIWLDRFEAMARAFELRELHAFVSVDRTGALPRDRDPSAHPHVRLEVVRDPGEYRGTAGVVRDLTTEYAADDWILVAAANQVLDEPLELVFEALSALGESVSIVPDGGSELAGIFLLKCGRLRQVPEIGFVDLKEQAIPATLGQDPLRIARRAPGSMRPVRTLSEYVRALRAVHVAGASPAAASDPGGDSIEDPFAETWEPAFSIVEPGADVDGGAILQDSVVLAGARVAKGAALVRSVVCAGGVVRSQACLVEALVTPPK